MLIKNKSYQEFIAASNLTSIALFICEKLKNTLLPTIAANMKTIELSNQSLMKWT